MTILSSWWLHSKNFSIVLLPLLEEPFEAIVSKTGHIFEWLTCIVTEHYLDLISQLDCYISWTNILLEYKIDLILNWYWYSFLFLYFHSLFLEKINYLALYLVLSSMLCCLNKESNNIMAWFISGTFVISIS